MKKKNPLKSLSVRLPVLFVVSVIIIMVVMIPLVYLRFYNRMIEQYTRMAKGVTNPINELSRCAEKFAYETEEDRIYSETP